VTDAPATTPTASKVLYHVLSLDGGQGYVEAGLLSGIQKQLVANGKSGNFIDKVNVLAGTSAGGWLALFLACFDKISDGLDQSMDFWCDAMQALHPQGLEAGVRGIGAALGQSAVLSPNRLRDFFLEVYGPTTRLGDLKHKVVIPTFKITEWRDKIFHNFNDNDPDDYELLADVALRTGASPLMFPLWQSVTEEGPGYVDGGFSAPTPALAAVTQILKLDPEAGRHLPLREFMSVLSVGISNYNPMEPQFIDGQANWGYKQWVLDPKNPILMLTLSLWAGTQAISHATSQLLGPDRFFRIAPTINEGTPGFLQTSAQLKAYVNKVIGSPDIETAIHAAADWLASPASAWFDTDAPSMRPRTKK
jgi:hypothetical protein